MTDDRILLPYVLLLNSFLLPFLSPLCFGFYIYISLTRVLGSFTMHSSLPVWLVVFRTAWIIKAAPNGGKCYEWNGDQIHNQSPCTPEARACSCCRLGDSCLSNGRCRNETLTPYFTGGCTDSTWNSPSVCPEICNNNKIRQVSSHDAIPPSCTT